MIEISTRQAQMYKTTTSNILIWRLFIQKVRKQKLFYKMSDVFLHQFYMN